MEKIELVKSSFKENMPEIWGEWGVSSEIGKLKAVLMRRPGKEIEDLDDPVKWRMKSLWDPEKVRVQHDALVGTYREHGVKVHYIEEMAENRPNGIYVRDLVFMTPEGAIIARPALSCRTGEEKYAAKQLIKLGVPIIKTINGTGIFEGACAIWLDRETVFLGEGYRCNPAGADQVERELRNIGVKNVIRVNIPRGQAHLDGFISIVDLHVALTVRLITPNIVYEELLKRNFTIVEVPDLEEFYNFAANVVALEPGKVVMPTGNPKTQALLEKAGVEVIPVDVSEIMKGYGSVHCMTAFLKREEIPLYSIEKW